MVSITLLMFICHLLKGQSGQILTSLRTKSHLENYNILCLFDVEFPYTRKLFETLSTDQVGMLKSKWAQVSYIFILRLQLWPLN